MMGYMLRQTKRGYRIFVYNEGALVNSIQCKTLDGVCNIFVKDSFVLFTKVDSSPRKRELEDLIRALQVNSELYALGIEL